MFRDRGLVEEMVKRAAGAGYEALVFTVDLTVHGRRERDVRRGFELPPKIGLDTLLDGAIHPCWTWKLRPQRADPLRQRGRRARGRRLHRGDARRLHRRADGPGPHLEATPSGCARSGTARSSSRGSRPSPTPVIAADEGIDAIALSNHGGRQLDSAPAIVDLVAPVADAVGDRIEIICDGGMRRGSDIVKAVALGARACMAGRAYLYGLGAAGERGVDHVLELFDADMRRIMALIGAHDIAALDRSSWCRSPPRADRRVGARRISGRGGCRRRRCRAGR